jgi:altronate dehydratase
MTRLSHPTVVLNEVDNVATALEGIPAGAELVVCFGRRQYIVRSLEAIPRGHKISLTTIHVGNPIVKYGETIGVATQDIPAGTHVHIHNTRSQRARGNKWKETLP